MFSFVENFNYPTLKIKVLMSNPPL